MTPPPRSRLPEVDEHARSRLQLVDPAWETSNGLLRIRSANLGGHWTLALEGELDLSNAATLDQEIRLAEASARRSRSTSVVSSSSIRVACEPSSSPSSAHSERAPSAPKGTEEGPVGVPPQRDRGVAALRGLKDRATRPAGRSASLRSSPCSAAARRSRRAGAGTAVLRAAPWCRPPALGGRGGRSRSRPRRR